MRHIKCSEEDRTYQMAHAIDAPSKYEEPRPSSSMIIKLWLVAFCMMKAISFISTMNVLQSGRESVAGRVG
jgi:hypothetical protein